jgi:GAF domain-containing protein
MDASTGHRDAPGIARSEPSGFAVELAGAFARMSGLLLSEQTVQTSLSLITSLAQETLPDTVGAGVTLVDELGRRTTSAASTPLVERADSLQYELDEGPCLTAFAQRHAVRIDDLSQDRRWPRWTDAVLPLGLRSSLSVPLVAGDVTHGAVKVYSDRPETYGEREERLLTMFAAQAAVLVANVQAYEAAGRLSEEVKKALRDRDVLAMARGVLMDKQQISEESAFRMLVSLAAQRGAPMATIAAELLRATSNRSADRAPR